MNVLPNRSGKILATAIIFVSLFLISGCDLEIIVDQGGGDLEYAVEQVVSGVLDIIEIFD